MIGFLPLIIIWIGHVIISYYFIRPISNKLIQIILTLLPCILLTYITGQNLIHYYVSSAVIIGLCWLISIRLIYLIILSNNKSVTFEYFLFKTFWILFPILPLKSKRNECSLKYYFILFSVKLLINHWIYLLTINCQTRIIYEKVFLFYIYLMTLSYPFDLGIILIRILTQDKYTFESFTNFPIFSLSLREFWGQRYNRFFSTVFKESIFEPIRLKFSSSSLGSLITFIISGLLHVHMAFIVLDGTSSMFSTFMFFFLHGIACYVEIIKKIQLSQYSKWLLTHVFLLITAPLMLRPFIKEGSPFFIINPPPLINVEWISKLPIPNFCT